MEKPITIDLEFSQFQAFTGTRINGIAMTVFLFTLVDREGKQHFAQMACRPNYMDSVTDMFCRRVFPVKLIPIQEEDGQREEVEDAQREGVCLDQTPGGGCDGSTAGDADKVGEGIPGEPALPIPDPAGHPSPDTEHVGEDHGDRG